MRAFHSRFRGEFHACIDGKRLRENRCTHPKDTKDYPKGVWTLPPNYAEGDKDRERYAAIGESDRFTLKFVKPAKWKR